MKLQEMVNASCVTITLENDNATHSQGESYR